MAVDVFREALSRFPAGVVVVTAVDSGCELRGLTVSAFCSVSVDPPLVLVCVDKQSNTLPAIHHARAFTVNILAAGGEEVAKTFASKGDGKFDGIDWIRSPALKRAGPILHDDVAAYLVCSLQQTIEAGDHEIVVGLVVEVGNSESEHALVYHRRRFSTVGVGAVVTEGGDR